MGCSDYMKGEYVPDIPDSLHLDRWRNSLGNVGGLLTTALGGKIVPVNRLDGT